MAKSTNTGTDNTGENNSGDRNSGNRNSGDRNSGDRNSGYCNSGDWNSGGFNTVEPDALFFNKPTTIKLSEFVQTSAWPDFYEMNPCVWIESSIMTDKEKTKNPTHETTGGYIKKLSYKDAWAVFWRKTSDENKKKVLALPNFDKIIFREITGIEVDDVKEEPKVPEEIELNGYRYKLLS